VTGLVLYSINNIYTVLTEQGEVTCRIKGKTLREEEVSYNPIAPGDRVVLEQGLILKKQPRKNQFIRWNNKRKAPQTLAANIDCLLCISSSKSPPFRPRFIDRILVAAEAYGITAGIVLNKMDLGQEQDVELRLENYSSLGYKVFRSSIKTGEGVKEIKEWIFGKTVLFVGQSGVGKSSILNEIDPGIVRRVGELSQKYNRGSHTTCFASLQFHPEGAVIDTPGIREIDLFNIHSRELYHYFRDITIFAPLCSLRSCMHINEPGCKVFQAVQEGRIHQDRYESYTRIYYDLLNMEKKSYG